MDLKDKFPKTYYSIRRAFSSIQSLKDESEFLLPNTLFELVELLKSESIRKYSLVVGTIAKGVADIASSGNIKNKNALTKAGAITALLYVISEPIGKTNKFVANNITKALKKLSVSQETIHDEMNNVLEMKRKEKTQKREEKNDKNREDIIEEKMRAATQKFEAANAEAKAIADKAHKLMIEDLELKTKEYEVRKASETNMLINNASGNDSDTVKKYEVETVLSSSLTSYKSSSDFKLPTSIMRGGQMAVNVSYLFGYYNKTSWDLREKSGYKEWVVNNIASHLSNGLLLYTKLCYPHFNLDYKIFDCSFTLRWNVPKEENGSRLAKEAVDKSAFLFSKAKLLDEKKKATEKEKEMLEKEMLEHEENCLCSQNEPLIPLPLVMSTEPFNLLAEISKKEVHSEFIEWVEIHSSLHEKLKTAMSSKHADERLSERFKEDKKINSCLSSRKDRVLARCERLSLQYNGLCVNFSRYGCCVISVDRDAKSHEKGVPININNENYPINKALEIAYRKEMLTLEETRKMQTAYANGFCKCQKKRSLHLITPIFTFIFNEQGTRIITCYKIAKGNAIAKESIGCVYGMEEEIEGRLV